MKKNTHRFYIMVIVILVLANIALYLGKDGRFNAAASRYEYEALVQPEEEKTINLNTATATELMTVNGIGPATAEKIIRRREELGQFRRVEDLLSVEDIGEQKFENFKEYFYVDIEENQD